MKGDRGSNFSEDENGTEDDSETEEEIDPWTTLIDVANEKVLPG